MHATINHKFRQLNGRKCVWELILIMNIILALLRSTICILYFQKQRCTRVTNNIVEMEIDETDPCYMSDPHDILSIISDFIYLFFEWNDCRNRRTGFKRTTNTSFFSQKNSRYYSRMLLCLVFNSWLCHHHQVHKQIILSKLLAY